MSAYDNLSDMQLDVMREIGNIGAGNACTALSVLLGTTVDMSVPSIHLLSSDSVVEHLGGEANDVLGICVDVTDDLQGMMINVITKSFAERIINTFYAKTLENMSTLDEMDSSVLNEMANITSGAYANSLASLTGLVVNIGTPSQVPGTVSSVMRIPMDQFMSPGEKLVVIDEEFLIGEERVSSNMILALESDSLVKLFGKLGVQI